MHRLLFLAATLLATRILTAAPDHPIIPALERDGLNERLRGTVLLGELRCTSCHPPGPRGVFPPRKKALDLASVGARLRPEYLRGYIANPQRTKPGTTMPNVLGEGTPGASTPEERDRIAEALTHYLVSLVPAPVSPGAPDHVAAERGRALYHSVGCVACHDPRSEDGEEVSIPDSAPLGRLEEKYTPATLTAFLAEPRRARPASRMPDLGLTPNEAYDIAHYLTARSRVVAPLAYTLYFGVEGGLDALEGREARAGVAQGFDLAEFSTYRDDFAVRFDGFVQLERDGEYEFVLESSAVARFVIDSTRVAEVEGGGRSSATIELAAGLHPVELLFLHRRGAPRLALSAAGPGLERGPIPATMLRSEATLAPSPVPFVVDSAKAKAGGALYRDLGCARCHALGDARPNERSLAELDPGRGCLSQEFGRWPDYALSERQVGDLRAALAGTSPPPSAEERARTTLAIFNCIACHERGEWGGISPERNDFFTSEDENLGETGRVPPPLTGVGAKLEKEWLRKTIAHGQTLRPYVRTRMPAFGAENTHGLADLFAELDRVPAVEFEPLPKDRKRARAITDIGHKLVGEQAMSCITCHTFRGIQSGSMAAIDLVETTTQRLRKDWFYHYMLDPPRFRSITIMPQYFAGGESVFPDIADGDPKRQLHAMWEYLAEGRNTRAPRGLRRPPMEIVVGDEAVMLRRKAQGAGKRAISVGYPLGLNLIFDAESPSVQQVWRGKFVDPSGVWRGQGSGSARVLSRDRVELGRGSAWAELADENDPWPSGTSRERNIRFRGYELGARQRPSFLYRFGTISISDSTVDIADGPGGRAFLRRTLSLYGEEERTVHFRLAVHEKIVRRDDGTIEIDGILGVVAKQGSGADSPELVSILVRSSSRGAEAIVPIEIRAGSATLVLDYVWLEAER